MMVLKGLKRRDGAEGVNEIKLGMQDYSYILEAS